MFTPHKLGGGGRRRTATEHWLGNLRPGPAPLCVQTLCVATKGLFE